MRIKAVVSTDPQRKDKLLPDHMPRQPEPERMDLPHEADAYAETDFGEVNDDFVMRLTAHHDVVGPCRAADLGTGPGDIPLRLARVRPSWHITAYDASPAMLRHATDAAAREGVGPVMTFVLADAKNLPADGNVFDLVFSNSLLHHMPDPVPLWREIRRVTRPEGSIFVQDLFRPADTAGAQRIVEQHAAGASDLLKEEFYRSLLAAFRPEEIRGQLAEAGLDHLNIEVISDRHVVVEGRR